jgi:hypothetical protein
MARRFLRLTAENKKGAPVMWDHVNTIVTVAAFVLTAVGMMQAAAWKLSKVVIDLKGAISAVKLEIESKAAEVERHHAQKIAEVIERSNAVVHDFGETISALRLKIHEVEMWSRDNFVRRDGFYKVRDDLKADIREMGDELKSDLKDLSAEIKAIRAGT